MRSFSAQKGALTKAIKSGDPTRVTAEVARFYSEYEDEDKPLPDAWHRWHIALQDALHVIRARSIYYN